jgi:asparagine synthase (glutamine-hydrolysing)
MCGIAGVFVKQENGRVSEEILIRMLSTLHHRGPDESGIFISPRLGMGNARLSIIGIDGGNQPIKNEDGRLWIVFNGEAFNYIELKEELVQKGHRFSTRTDTEVVLHLYEEYGADCLSKINGQFAFAVWDAARQKLFLARDRVGIRPLHYYSDAHMFVFASEIKAVFQHPMVPRELDLKSLNQIFTLWTTLGPATAFKGIRELPPGHFMRVSSAGETVSRFWSIPSGSADKQLTGTWDEACEELAALVEDAVRIRLRADVPVGAYLSGGLDSSIVTALTATRFNNRLRTFSIGFQEERFDESVYQSHARNFLGTEHTQILVANTDIRRNLPEVIWHCETPLLRTAPIPLFLLSRAVRDNRFKVVLTGEGADEIFGGYNIFKEDKIRRFMARQPSSRLRPLLLQRLYPYIFKTASPGRAYLEKFFAAAPQDLLDPVFSHRVRWQNTGRIRNFLSDEVGAALNGGDPIESVVSRLPDGFSARDSLAKAQFLEMEIFLSNYLLSSQGDRVAMAHSLETRMPFLDYRVVEFAFRLPPHWKLNGLTEKYILKKTFAGLLPDSVIQRPKQPYRAPIREAFAGGESRDYLDELLSESALKRAGYFNPIKTAGLAKKIRQAGTASPNEVQDMAFLGILTTQLVHRQFIEDFRGRDVQLIKPDKIVRAGAVRQEQHD